MDILGNAFIDLLVIAVVVAVGWAIASKRLPNINLIKWLAIVVVIIICVSIVFVLASILLSADISGPLSPDENDLPQLTQQLESLAGSELFESASWFGQGITTVRIYGWVSSEDYPDPETMLLEHCQVLQEIAETHVPQKYNIASIFIGSSKRPDPRYIPHRCK